MASKNIKTDYIIDGALSANTVNVNGNAYAIKFITSGGTASQFVKGDGTLDSTAYGVGDVIKVGTPMINQMAVWTGDGTIQGLPNFTQLGASLYVGQDDFTRGFINAYGDSGTNGGTFTIWNGATGDTDDAWYDMYSNNGVFTMAGWDTGSFLTYTSSTEIIGILKPITSNQTIAQQITTGNTSLITKEFGDSAYLGSGTTFSTSLSGLTDTTITAPSNDDVLTWNSSSNKWEAKEGGGLGSGSTVTHVQSSSATTWTFNHNLGTTYPIIQVWDINDNVMIPNSISVVDAYSVEIGFSVASNGTASAVAGGVSVPNSTLSALTDTNISGASDNQVLSWDTATAKWIAVTPSATGVTSVGTNAPLTGTITTTGSLSITQATTSTDGYLSSTDWNTFNGKTSTVGTVTSIGLSVPTGLTVSNTPITSSGVIALTYTAGYSIPTTVKQGQWDTAYNDKINSASFNTSDGILTLTQQDTDTITIDLDGRYSIGDFLPLSGGTLTGILSGTSGNFLNTITASGGTFYDTVTIGVTDTYLDPMVHLTRGVQAAGNDSGLPVTIGYPYLSVGGQEWLADAIYSIGFGWDDGNKQAIEIGMQTTDTAGNVAGDFFVATRTLAADTTPTIKFKVKADGSLGLTSYGSGTISGTTAYSLAVDSSGNIIETTSGNTVDLTGYSPTGHTHTESDITDLQDYSLTGHTHTLSALTDTELSAVTDGSVIIYNSGTTKWEAGEIVSGVPLESVGIDELESGFTETNASTGVGTVGFGEQIYTTSGTYTFTATTSSVSVVAVGGGGGGGSTGGSGGGGGGGGGLGYKNNISVISGNTYTVVVGVGGTANSTTHGGDSYFISTGTVCGFGGLSSNSATGGIGGGFSGDSGGNGGTPDNSGISDSTGGGGAGGYSGNGGGSSININGTAGSGGGGGGGAAGGSSDAASGGGGVGLFGEGASGAGGVYTGADAGAGGGGGSGGGAGGNGLSGVGGAYGGGGAGAELNGETGNGASGAVRIIWGVGAEFPSTGTTSGTTSTINSVNWNDGIQFDITMTGATHLTFENIIEGKTITLVVSGNYTLTLPSGVNTDDISGFDGTLTNYIQIYCVDSVTPVFLSSLKNYI